MLLSSFQVLDTKDLQIFKVTANGQDAKFAFGEKHSFKGTPLEITLPFEMRRYALCLLFQMLSKACCISCFAACGVFG